MDMHTFGRNIANNVRSEVASVMTKVETRAQDAILTSVEKRDILKKEQAM